MKIPQEKPQSVIQSAQEYFQEKINSVRLHVFWILSKSSDIEHTYASEIDFSKTHIHPNRLIEVGKITKNGMLHHLFSHYLLLFLAKWWVFYVKDELVVSDTDIFSQGDKYGMEYDLYLSFLSGIEFDPIILNFEFVSKNKIIIETHLEQMIKNFEESNKKYVQKVFQKQMKQTLSSHKEQLYMWRYVALADLLGLMNIGFVKDFTIEGHMIEMIDSIPYDTKPIFMAPMFQEIFWTTKSINVTKENYQEIKQKIQIARENFLRDLWVENFSDKKEISQRLIERFQ